MVSRSAARHRNPRVALRCAACRRRYGDPLYRGPRGHAPQRVCLDCWLSEWDRIVRMMHQGRDWTEVDTALALLCENYSFSEVADLMGRSRRTLLRRLRNQNRTWDDLPEWLQDRLDRRCRQEEDLAYAQAQL